jgi:glycosyltransferase involved in cell wall biosynthesis
MVTRDRPRLARRAIRCFAAQTWSNKELVIIDDGEVDYRPVLEELEGRFLVAYHRLRPVPGKLLGALRNESLDRAAGEYCIQWDDDEWYHPSRIERQMGPVLEDGRDGSLLAFTLMHCDTAEYGAHPFRTGLPFGTPGSLLHRRTHVRYPNLARAEDSAFLRALGWRQKLSRLGKEESHLLVRCYHGGNTWDASHFTERLRFGPLGKMRYLKARYVDRDLYAHAAFALDPREREAIAAFLEQSRRLGVLRH